MVYSSESAEVVEFHSLPEENTSNLCVAHLENHKNRVKSFSESGASDESKKWDNSTMRKRGSATTNPFSVSTWRAQVGIHGARGACHIHEFTSGFGASRNHKEPRLRFIPSRSETTSAIYKERIAAQPCNPLHMSCSKIHNLILSIVLNGCYCFVRMQG